MTNHHDASDRERETFTGCEDCGWQQCRCPEPCGTCGGAGDIPLPGREGSCGGSCDGPGYCSPDDFQPCPECHPERPR